MKRSPARYAVLGAGALGLTVGMRLAQRGDDVVVFEREAMPGGLAAGFPLGNAHLERFYHHLFRTDTRAVRLIEELGLGDRMMWRTPETAVLRNGRLWRMDSAPSVLRFAPVPMTSRLRLGASLTYLKAVGKSNRFEGKTAADWIRRSMGRSVYEALWEPLLVSKFGDRHLEVALPWFWARVHYRTASLGYLRGGFQQLYDSLTHKIFGLGSHVRLSAEVKEIRPQRGGLLVATDRGEEVFDAVVSTLPTRVTAAIVPALPHAYSQRYGRVEAYGAMCLVLDLDRQLTDAYWINVNDAGFPFQPVVEHTNFVSADDYGGRHLVYFGNYLPVNSPLFTKSKEEVLNGFVPGIRRLNPDFEESWIRDSWLFKAPFAQPIVDTAYRERIPPHVTPIPGLFLANMFQVYPQDRGQNYSIALAERLVRDVL
jgi:protoporphyrinogen oxidase